MKIIDAISRLDNLDTDAIARAALAGQGAELAEQVRTALSTPPGGPHDHPWLRTGALRDSVAVTAAEDRIVIGSTSAVALYQEHGTAELPPRPTFAPLAAAQGQAVARAVGKSVADAITQTLGRR